MYVLGISCYYHDSAAAILKDGKIIAAIEEERFSRKKFDDGFPDSAIKWCLNQANIIPKEISWTIYNLINFRLFATKGSLGRKN